MSNFIGINPRRVRSWGFAISLIASAGVLATSTFAEEPNRSQQVLTSSQTKTDAFPVVEFRRYTIKPGGREQFAQYFQSYFPEAFQQLNAMALGQFLERDHQNGFTWLRGFPNIETRAIANSAFYYGPVWKEHRVTLNNLIDDSDNVILMHPLEPGRGIPVLPAVDPVTEADGAHGILVAQLFAVKPDEVENFARQVEPVFARYREAGIREAGVLVTLNVANNFPQLPVRSDGPYLLWLGLVKNQTMLEKSWQPMMELASNAFNDTRLLRQPVETITMDPTSRSRLRWQ